MPTTQKVEKVEELAAALADAKAIYLADYTGSDVARVTDLRNKLREADVGYQVVKNRLAKRALEVAGLNDLDAYLNGPTAIAISKDDLISPAKILQEVADEEGQFEIKSGFADGKMLSSEDIKALSKLPSREELIVKVLGSVQSPLYGFASVLSGLLRNLAGVVAAIEEKERNG